MKSEAYFRIMGVHLGNKVMEILDKRGMSKSELARRINKHNATIHDILNRESMDTELLKTLSVVLEYNFFIYLAHNSNMMFDERGNNDYGVQLSTYPIYVNSTGDEEFKNKYFNLIERYTTLLEENVKYSTRASIMNEPNLQPIKTLTDKPNPYIKK